MSSDDKIFAEKNSKKQQRWDDKNLTTTAATTKTNSNYRRAEVGITIKTDDFN
jgi:hypothetical protein